MSRALLILNSTADRVKASSWVAKAPPGTRVEFKRAKRTTDQNAKMWAALTDVSEQQTHYGLKLKPDAWKLLFLDALKREVRAIPNLDGTGFIDLGRSSSDLSVSEMADLIEVIQAWGAEHGVVFHEAQEQERAA